MPTALAWIVDFMQLACIVALLAIMMLLARRLTLTNRRIDVLNRQVNEHEERHARQAEAAYRTTLN